MPLLNMQRPPHTVHLPQRKLALRQAEVQVFIPPNKRHTANKPESMLKRLWGGLKRHKWQIMLLLLLGITGGIIVTLITPVTYRATVQLQITSENGSTTNPSFLANSYELLKSRLLARKVIDAIGFSSNGDDQKQTNAKNFLSHLTNEVKTLINSDDSGIGSIPLEEHFLEALTIEPVPDSTLVKIHYDSPEPLMAARIANEIATQFIAIKQTPEATTTDAIKGVISTQINDAKIALEKSEAALAEYAKKYEITATTGSPDPNADRLTQLEASVTEAEKIRIDTESLYEQSRKGETIQFLTDNPAVRNLQDTYNKLQADYQEKLKFYKPGYPAMLDIQEQMNSVKKQVDEGIKTARDEVKTKYLTAQQKEVTLRKELAQQKDKLLDIRQKMVAYNALQREVETNHSIYQGLLQNITNVNANTDIATGKISIIDSAIPPYAQFSPNINLNLAIGAILGLLAGFILTFLQEHFDDRIRSQDSLENLLSIPALGYIPYGKPKQNSAFPLNQNSATTEAFRTLRANLMFAADLEKKPVIHITSAIFGEGKTDVCLNMASSFAQTGKKVLLVDGNLRKPSLHHRLQVSNKEGLSNFLNGKSNLEQVIFTTQIHNVYLLPAGPSVTDLAELLLDGQMHELLALVPRKFDMIILDSPPVLGIADALVLSHWANITLLVVAHGQSREKSVLDAYHRLRHTRSVIIGSVLTKVKEKHNRYKQDHKKIKLPQRLAKDT